MASVCSRNEILAEGCRDGVGHSRRLCDLYGALTFRCVARAMTAADKYFAVYLAGVATGLIIVLVAGA